MLRASLKATSPFKFMTDFSQLQEPGPDSSGSNSSEKTQDALVWQERRKTLKPTGSFRRDSMRQTGDDTADLQSVISEQTMESYHGGGGGMFNDGEVAVANPVEWLEAKKKNLRPTSLRLPPSSSHAAAAAAAAATEEAMDDQRSVGTSITYHLRTTTSIQPHTFSTTHFLTCIYDVELCDCSSLRYNLFHTTTIHPPPSIYSIYPLMNMRTPFSYILCTTDRSALHLRFRAIAKYLYHFTQQRLWSYCHVLHHQGPYTQTSFLFLSCPTQSTSSGLFGQTANSH